LCPTKGGGGVEVGKFSLMLLAYPHEDIVIDVKFFIPQY
jgi:hypothetical protein